MFVSLMRLLSVLVARSLTVVVKVTKVVTQCLWVLSIGRCHGFFLHIIIDNVVLPWM